MPGCFSVGSAQRKRSAYHLLLFPLVDVELDRIQTLAPLQPASPGQGLADPLLARVSEPRHRYRKRP
jgi:hypothetical protein